MMQMLNVLDGRRKVVSECTSTFSTLVVKQLNDHRPRELLTYDRNHNTKLKNDDDLSKLADLCCPSFGRRRADDGRWQSAPRGKHRWHPRGKFLEKACAYLVLIEKIQ